MIKNNVDKYEKYIDMIKKAKIMYTKLMHKNYFKIEWNKKFKQTSLQKGKLYFQIQNKVFYRPWFFNTVLTRKDISMIYRLRFEHNIFSCHLYRIDLTESHNNFFSFWAEYIFWHFLHSSLLKNCFSNRYILDTV